MKTKRTRLTNIFVAILLLFAGVDESHATIRTSVTSGDWNSSSTWFPSGSPSPTDNVTISPGHTVTVSTNQTIHHVTVSTGATLTWSTINTLSITGNLTVNGTVTMNGGNLSLTNYGLQFILGNNSVFTWDPGTNTAAAATLFTNGIESFSPTSTLIIKKWYNYAVSLTAFMTGNFGNLELNSFNGTAIAEWNQNNGFQTRQILGTLTVDQGWITLDKSGNITTTTIGKIVLKNINSTLYVFHGTHPTFFTLNTSSITNNGGTFYGLADGNGAIHVHVTGNFTNSGNVKIINNSGIAGVSNGNALFTVDSTYTQTTGDTRIIYNVSTTNSGLFTASIRNLKLNGGIFMGQSGCRISGGLCTLNITEDLTINFANVTDKFRGTSISSIGNSMNNVQLQMNIGRNLSISGVLNAEVTSAASAGSETVVISGTATISGCNVNFNYGSTAASHANTLTVNGNVSLTGGIIFLSRNNGTSVISMNGNLALSAGQVTVKGGDNTATMVVAGTFSQSGGQFYIHNNSAAASTMPCTMNVLNNFIQTGGTFCFDSNSSNSNANHQLVLSGSSFSVSGNSALARAGAGTSTSFGIINFKRNGIMNYSRSGNSTTISQVKQVISNTCTVKIISGDFLVASSPGNITSLLQLNPGSALNAMSSRIVSNGIYLISSVFADSNATISTQRTQGFFDGTPFGCISSGMTFSLDPHSTIEYNGSLNQALTGNFAGVLPVQNQYGILKINMQGNAKAMMSDPVIVRSKIILTNGELNLGGNILTLNSGTSNSIVRTSGYMNCEIAGGLSAGTFIWKNMYKGLHEFPFGVSPTAYLPVNLFFIAGNVTDVTATTYSTPAADNMPLPQVNGALVNFSTVANTYSNTNLMDRWWVIDAPGVTAGITVTYRGIENTLDPGYQHGQMGFVSWTGSGWCAPASAGTGVTSGLGTVSAEIISDFSAFTVGKQSGLKMIASIHAFTAEEAQGLVSLNWTTEVERNCDYFVVERSADGETFEEIERTTASGNSDSPLKYSAIDHSPLQGRSYYRIKQVSKSQLVSYSNNREINISERAAEVFTIEFLGPNPFATHYVLQYHLEVPGEVKFEFSNSNGQSVFQKSVMKEAGEQTFEFTEGSNLQPGIYFLKITFGGKVFTRKLIKK